MKRTTVGWFGGFARHLRDQVFPGRADTDLLAFGMAVQYLRNLFGNDWANEILFGQHPTVSKGNVDGRAFLRAEAETTADRFRNQQRALRLGELFFNMQHVEGIETRYADMKAGLVEPTFFELEAGGFVVRRTAAFRYVLASGQKGFDFDGEITVSDQTRVSCEMKCKVESTRLGKGAVINSLNAARGQLPAGGHGIAFLKIPEQWLADPQSPVVISGAINEFLRNTSRVAAVFVHWEEQRLDGVGARFEYRFRVERGPVPKPVPAAIEALLLTLSMPATRPWTSFRQIATECLAGK